MIDKDKILEAYNFRHACKVFDENKKISEEDFAFIMQTARLSPSSFGMEPWRFLVITNDAKREALKAHCWGQAQITTSSHMVVVLTQTQAVEDDGYIERMFNRRGLDKVATEGYIAKYKVYIKEMIMGFATRYLYRRHLKVHAIHEWCARQCYIAAANMTTSAAMIGIDSCFIEGFKKEPLEKALAIDTSKEEVALVLTFGYRVKEQPSKHRKSMDEIMEILA